METRIVLNGEVQIPTTSADTYQLFQFEAGKTDEGYDHSKLEAVFRESQKRGDNAFISDRSKRSYILAIANNDASLLFYLTMGMIPKDHEIDYLRHAHGLSSTRIKQALEKLKTTTTFEDFETSFKHPREITSLKITLIYSHPNFATLEEESITLEDIFNQRDFLLGLMNKKVSYLETAYKTHFIPTLLNLLRNTTFIPNPDSLKFFHQPIEMKMSYEGQQRWFDAITSGQPFQPFNHFVQAIRDFAEDEQNEELKTILNERDERQKAARERKPAAATPEAKPTATPTSPPSPHHSIDDFIAQRRSELQHIKKKTHQEELETKLINYSYAARIELTTLKSIDNATWFKYDGLIKKTVKDGLQKNLSDPDVIACYDLARELGKHSRTRKLGGILLCLLGLAIGVAIGLGLYFSGGAAALFAGPIIIQGLTLSVQFLTIGTSILAGTASATPFIVSGAFCLFGKAAIQKHIENTVDTAKEIQRLHKQSKGG